MTTQKSPGRGADDLLARARRQYRRMSEALGALIDRMMRGETVEAREAERLLRDHMRVLNLALEQEAKVAERRRQEAPGEGGVLDLDRARAEIARRIARLGGAGSSGGVS
ncbi:MAG: hypothetical protein D6688_13590 [Alphaproteobacteria bacterium]|nr:MAG: hypothetical protein D6688_13590 [Alphaproteobacteria bacterium]